MSVIPGGLKTGLVTSQTKAVVKPAVVIQEPAPVVETVETPSTEEAKKPVKGKKAKPEVTSEAE